LASNWGFPLSGFRSENSGRASGGAEAVDPHVVAHGERDAVAMKEQVDILPETSLAGCEQLIERRMGVVAPEVEVLVAEEAV
jgi:hypothetical protein